MAKPKLFSKAGKNVRQFTAKYITGKSLRWVERFVFGWLAVFIIGLVLLSGQFKALDKHYLVSQPSPGGRYTEGLVGEIGGINPLFPESRASRSGSALIFSGLFSYDEDGRPAVDLAEDWEVSDNETVYTVKLRQDAYWHDGKRVTATDAVFTFETIQDPDAGSPLQPAWQDIEIEQTGEFELSFALPNPYAPFLNQLTVGILPEHLLGDVEPARLRITGFNTEPVGSGPFRFEETSISGNEIRLNRNNLYYLGPANLESFTIRLFESEEDMTAAFNQNRLSAMIQGDAFDHSVLSDPENSRVERMRLSSQVFAFFNMERLPESDLRQGLVRGIDHAKLVNDTGISYEPADSPLLRGHIGYQSSQPSYSPAEARSRFESAGWEMKEGQLLKDNRPLTLTLVTQDTPSYTAVAELLRKQWGELGVSVEVVAVPGVELQQDHIRPRDYDILLFGIGLENDPDVHAYWHSSQTKDPGLNLSGYASDIADESLDAGRTRSGEELRAAKYESFQQQWQRDAPAAALYRIHNHYIYRKDIGGIKVENVSHASNRFHNVEEWTVNKEPALRRQQPVD